MSGHTDLSISLRAASSGQHVLNGGPRGAIFPGWFLTVRENEGYSGIAGPIQVAVGDVRVAASMLDDIVDPDRNGIAVGPIEAAVMRCDAAMRDRLKSQLAAAEAAAARIPALQAALAAHDGHAKERV